MIIKKLLLIGILITIIKFNKGDYTLNVLLNEFNNGQGFLADGTHCDNFWNVGHRCNIHLKIAVNINGTLNSPFVDLGNVTTNANSIVFGEGVYNAWYNPSQYVQTGQYNGFSISVEATEAKNGKLIDSFTTPFITPDRINDFTYFSHPRLNGSLEPTMISFAWYVQGDVASPQPTGPPPTTTTTPKPGEGYMDCESAFNAGAISESGTLKIGLMKGSSVTVYCEIDSKAKTAQTVVQSRGSIKATDFPFETYSFDDFKIEKGEPGPDNNYWMGLDNINSFTTGRTQKYNMSIIACCGIKTAVIQLYGNVAVSDKDSGYVITGTNDRGKGLAFKGLTTDFNSGFRTFDTFNDTTKPPPFAMCAIATKSNKNNLGGWWFGNCVDNLNGHYYSIDKIENKDTCELTDNDIETNGPGIELVDSENLGFMQITKKSYTRVRMAFYRSDGNGFSNNNDFCK